MTKYKLVFRRLKASRKQKIGIVTITALATAFLTITLVLTTTVRSSIAASASAPLSNADVVIKSAGGAEETRESRDTWVSVVKADPRLSSYFPVRSVFGEATAKETTPSVQITGISDASDLRWFSLSEGRWPNDSREIIADPGDGLSVGDNIPLRLTSDAETELRQVTVVGISDQQPLFSDSTIRLYSPEAFFSEGDEIRYITVRLNSGVDQSAVLTDLREELGDTAVVLSGADARALAASSSLAGVGQLQWMFNGLAALALLVGAILIRSSLVVLVARQQRSDALLRLVGMTASEVFRVTLAENALVSLSAASLGGLLGLAVAWPTGVALGFGAPSLPLGLWPVPISVIAGTLVSSMAAVGPSRGAGKTTPLEAFGQAPRRPDRVTALTNRLVRTARRILHPSNLPLLVALSFMEHSASRARAVVVTIGTCTMLVIGLLVGAASAGATMDHVLALRYPVDFSLTFESQDSNTEMAEESLQRIVGVSEVIELMGMEGDILRAGSEPFPLRIGVLDASLQAISAAPIPDLDERTVLVSPGLAKGLGVSPGGSVQISIGAVTESFAVRTNALADVNRGATVLISQAGASRMSVEHSHPISLWVAAQADANTADVNGAVSRVADHYVASLGGSFPERSQAESVVIMLTRLGIVLLSASVLVALIGVANVQRLSVIERRRSIAVLRALGLTGRELRASVLIESCLVAGMSAILGALIGFLCALVGVRLLLSDRGDLIYVIPWASLIAVIVLIICGSALAALTATSDYLHIEPAAALSED